MFTWIWVFLLCSWKIKTLFLKLEDQKLQTMQHSYKTQATSKDLRLIWGFAGRTYHIIGNIMSQLIDIKNYSEQNKNDHPTYD